jgi:flagellum-specific ATP synthase
MTSAERWTQFLDEHIDSASMPISPVVKGQLSRVTGLTLKAQGLKLAIGSICHIEQGSGDAVEAEVVGFDDRALYLMPTSDTLGLLPGARICAKITPRPPPVLGKPHPPRRRNEDRLRSLPIGSGLLGRVVDAQGVTLDGLGPLKECLYEPIHQRPLNAMQRAPIRKPLNVGVRAINALLTVGQGQRLGLFAGSGVGKSVLLGMMARYTEADVIVVGMIGERGREVKEFIDEILGSTGLRHSIVVVAPADQPAVLRMQAALYCTAIAEHFRDQGKQVLMLMDSLTRYAMAAREVALALGEAPATKGYPASVFALLPKLVERAGNGQEGGGSITAFYTVLTEGDDQQDPIADSARAILDGHLVLDRALADRGHFPALDIEKSISRVMHNVASDTHKRRARSLRMHWSRILSSADLIAVGAYVPGRDTELDLALQMQPAIEQFLQQEMTESSTFTQALQEMEKLLSSEVIGLKQALT